MQTVSVVGSGIGGLATAIRLAVKGYQVDVFEKNQGPGGKLSVIRNRDFIFDAGPSLFTQPGNLEELFSLAGKDIRDYFRYRSVDIACRYFFEDGRQVNAYTSAEAFAGELQAVTGEDPTAVLDYLRQSERVYEGVGTIFLNYSLHKPSTWLHRRILTAMRIAGYDHLFRTLDEFNRSRFRTTEAVQIFNRYATYNGSNPYRAPGMLSLIPHLEQNQGTFYPEGGMYSIVDALYRLALDLGVRFHFNRRVERILVRQGRAAGVVADGEQHASDFVVSNVDAYFTYLRLLQDPARAEKVLRRERSSSALIFYWGMAKEFPGLHLHNIFFTRNYPEEFRHLFDLKKMYADPTVYVNITAKMEKGQAPEGKENWFVMLNAPALAGPYPEEDVRASRRQVIDKGHCMAPVQIPGSPPF
ncbi:MAG: phytoene desaturase family protein [Chitinophagaceae bacterium]|nr:phytoene desaturase family protein [Chitinophagaceae bacterium]